MSKYLWVAAVIAILTLILSAACTSNEDSASPAATAPDIEATVEARVQATLTATEGRVGRLERVRNRGAVACASNDTLAGFGYSDASGNVKGFDIDLCRAVAAAVLGNPDAVELHNTTASERGPLLQSGEIDIMSRNTTWTSSRDAQWGNFAQTMFYDGQGFMVPNSKEVSSILELKGATICVQQGTTTELNLQDFDNQNQMGFLILTFPDNISTDVA